MTIKLTEEEKQTLKRRSQLRAAQSEFHQKLETDWLARASRTKLRKGKAQERARHRANALTFDKVGRTPKERRTDRYLNRQTQEFFQSDLWRKARYDALKRAGGKCECCGSRDNLHVDHIRPRSKFPELALAPDNLQVLCEACNIGKGSSDMTDWRRRSGEEKAPA